MLKKFVLPAMLLGMVFTSSPAMAQDSLVGKTKNALMTVVTLPVKAVTSSPVKTLANTLLMPARVLGDATTMLLAESAMITNRVTNKLDLTTDVDAVLLMQFDAVER